MKLITAALVALLLWPTLLLAGEPAQSYNQANEAYSKGDYAKAVALYEAALATPDADLYYNLGNAYYKSGELGKAIASYRRALILSPTDDDANANLSFVRGKRLDKMEAHEGGTLWRMLSFPYRSISMNGHAMALALIVTVLALAVYMRFGEKRETALKRLKLAVAVALLLAVAETSMLAAKTYAQLFVTHCAITGKAWARSAPAENAEKVFELNDGTEGTIQREENGYALLLLPTGWTGWVPLKSVEIINP